jgi:hypothetical protein
LLRQYGVNAILTESETYETTAIEAAHELGLRFYAGVACFSDHATNFRKLAERPQLWPIVETGERRPQMEWYVGISPTNHDHQVEVLAAIRQIVSSYAVDGLFLDFVRWPLHWEIELRPGRARPLDSSFDETTLAWFAAISGITLPPLRSASERAAWIHERHPREWRDFKCKVITDFVSKAAAAVKRARPGAELGIYMVPNIGDLSEPLTGQRMSELAPVVDWVAPMLYHNILLRPPTWIGRSLDEIVRIAGRKSLPVVQADSNRDAAAGGDWGPPMSIGDWKVALSEAAGRPDVAGLIVFPGTSLIGNSRGEVLRAIMGARR